MRIDARWNPQRSVTVGYVFATWIACAGCLTHGSTAGRDADASVSGARVSLRDLDAALADFESRLEAGRDIHQNDDWTVRLLVLGVLLLGLSYPVGKIVWIAGTALSRRAGPLRWYERGDDFIAFHQRRRASSEEMRPA